jgi:hypothetical protein
MDINKLKELNNDNIIIAKVNLFANNNNSLTQEVKEVTKLKATYFNGFNILYKNKNLLEIPKYFEKSIKSIKLVEKKYCNSCQIRITNIFKKQRNFKLLIKNLGSMDDHNFKILFKYLKTNKIIDQLLDLESYSLDLEIIKEFQGKFINNQSFTVDIYLYPLDFKYNWKDKDIIKKILIQCINKEATLPDFIELTDTGVFTEDLKLEKDGIIRELPSFISGYQEEIKKQEQENNIKIKIY